MLSYIHWQLKQQTDLSHSCKDGKSKVKVLSGWFLLRRYSLPCKWRLPHWIYTLSLFLSVTLVLIPVAPDFLLL